MPDWGQPGHCGNRDPHEPQDGVFEGCFCRVAVPQPVPPAWGVHGHDEACCAPFPQFDGDFVAIEVCAPGEEGDVEERFENSRVGAPPLGEEDDDVVGTFERFNPFLLF